MCFETTLADYRLQLAMHRNPQKSMEIQKTHAHNIMNLSGFLDFEILKSRMHPCSVIDPLPSPVSSDPLLVGGS